MSRMQLALRVGDLEGSITFYSKLFGAEPAKRQPGYANFAIGEPPMKLVLLEGEPGQDTAIDHLGVEVESTEQVNNATERLHELGLFTDVEEDTTCCYARQDKVWVHGPGREPWEVYVVKADSATFGLAPEEASASQCCANDKDAAAGQRLTIPLRSYPRVKAAARILVRLLLFPLRALFTVHWFWLG